MDNTTIAQHLRDYAEYLEAEDASIYRVRAYRRAAETVLTLDRPIKELVELEGRAGLEALPGIGAHLSYAIESLVRTGELHTLNREGGQIDPERLLTSLPGIGPLLARQIHDRLGIDTLEGLEQAVHDGRLAELGIGPKRLRGLRDALAGRFSRRPLRTAGEPDVADLLAVDEAYRRGAGASLLPMFAPRRFNPGHEPWLPIYETTRRDWRYRALYSNTALAHRLGQTHDWVVIYFDNGLTSGQRTVVTESRGDLRGRRVVRGREAECRGSYSVESAAKAS